MWFAAIVVRFAVSWRSCRSDSGRSYTSEKESIWEGSEYIDLVIFGDFPPVPAIHWLSATQMHKAPVSETAMCTVSTRHRFLVHPQVCMLGGWIQLVDPLLNTIRGNIDVCVNWNMLRNSRSRLFKVPLLVFSAATSAMDSYLQLERSMTLKFATPYRSRVDNPTWLMNDHL